jgi:fatty acid desaturase
LISTDVAVSSENKGAAHMTPARVQTSSRLFAYSRLDVIPVLAALAQLAFVIFLFLAFRHLTWWWLVPLGLIYSISISWNINGISHNFLHNPYFRSPTLNRLFSVLESVMLGFSQVFYENVHKRHHIGNADLPDTEGKTLDPLSIYKHGHDGHAENIWTYTFLSYLRDDPRETYNDIYRLSPREAYWGLVEIAAFILTFTLAFVLNWKFMCYFLPFYYFGHCLSYLNGYYLHLGGNPNVPIAWGVSSYHKLYNWIWFNNGYHAEHHYRPRLHWTQMKALHQQIADEQRAANVRVIKPPHALGFLDEDLRRDLRDGNTPVKANAQAAL